MNFTTYDLILLAIFVVFIAIFLFVKRKNVKKEGLLLLYKTGFGIKLINRVGNKYKKTLNVLSWISIVLGFLLMAGMLYLFGKIVWIYIFNASLIKMIKIPPVTPLIPYLPQIFKLNFLPPFYFTYWIVIIAIVAITHEFAHGIFAVSKKVRVKSTGFGFFPFFLPIFLAAFVELDEKQMAKKKNSSQMAVLSAGTFANILTAVLFFGVLALFFSLSFTPAGVIYDTYTYSVINVSTITSINNISVNNVTYPQILNLVNSSGKFLNEVQANNTEYFATVSFLEQQTGTDGYLLLYDDAPAIKANLSNTILEINDIEIKSQKELATELLKYSPKDKINITALFNGSNKDYEITLGENPSNKSLPYLGIGFIDRQGSGFLTNIVNVFSSFRDSSVYYKANFEAAEFIYNLLWWLVLICFSVALVNMLPVGIFDGGRFFFLAVLALTKSKEKAKKAFSIVTYLFLFLLFVIMIFWAINIFK
jgi:membrane-associated protease RseP (regulator of RpoE activity)